MEIKLLNICKDIILFFYKKINKKEIKEKEKKLKFAIEGNKRVIEYIDDILEDFQKIISYNEKSDKNVISMAHNRIKHASEYLVYEIGDLLTASEKEIIHLSLVSGRVLYYVALFGQVENDAKLLEDYHQRYLKYTRDEDTRLPLMRHNSYEKFIKYLIKDGKIIDNKEEQLDMMNKIIEVCEEDISRIKSIKERRKTKLVFSYIDKV